VKVMSLATAPVRRKAAVVVVPAGNRMLLDGRAWRKMFEITPVANSPPAGSDACRGDRLGGVGREASRAVSPHPIGGVCRRRSR